VTVADVFARCASEKRAALIPYLMAGDPSLEMTKALLYAASDGGADIIELGIPYSDPLADGPTIQAAAQRALHAATTFDNVLEMVANLDRARAACPILAFTYYNPLFVRGIERTAVCLAKAGFAGAIVPDLPPEESQDARAAFDRHGIGLTFLVAPTTPLDRVRSIAAQSSDFVYVVSRMGVTGARRKLGENVKKVVEVFRSVVDKPLAVGFGVSTPDHALAIAEYADGVIVGSALIDRVAASPGAESIAVRDYCASLAAAVRRRVTAR
jgi:tryptophan synthase alpha chain